MDLSLRRAESADADRVAAITADTWPDRDRGDYVSEAFPHWLDDDPDRAAFVCEADGRVVGVVHAVLLSATEAWLSGIRVAHDARGNGVGRRLTDRALRWIVRRDAAVCRTLVHAWNGPSLGLAAAAGFEPLAPVRVLRPDPVATNPDDLDYSVGSDPDAGWTFWTQSAARTALSGLSATPVEPYSFAELTRERLRLAADDGRLLTVRRGGTAGLAVRTRVGCQYGHPPDVAEYALAAWETPAAAKALFDALRRDAAATDADSTQIPVPEGPRWAMAAARAGVPVDTRRYFLLAADLSAPTVAGGL